MVNKILCSLLESNIYPEKKNPAICLTQFDPQILISDVYDGKIKY
jgi:hypothetical protein